jgi:transcriptional regulator with XRE-family HTH domain
MEANMDNRILFGDYLRTKRLEKRFTLRGFARAMEMSPVFLCEVEKNRRGAPGTDRLQKIARLLRLDKQETERLYDYAAESKKRPAVSNDLPEYIMENEIVRIALRTAKDVDATDTEWQKFIDELNKRIVRQDQNNTD